MLKHDNECFFTSHTKVIIWMIVLTCAKLQSIIKSKYEVKEIIIIKIKNFNNLHFPRIELKPLNHVSWETQLRNHSSTWSWIWKSEISLIIVLNRICNLTLHVCMNVVNKTPYILRKLILVEYDYIIHSNFIIISNFSIVF